MTLWQLIDGVGKAVPLTRAKVEALLGTTLRVSDNTSNEYFDLWVGGGVALDGKVEVSDIDLRIKRKGPDAGFMVLSLKGNCVTLPEVRSHYPDAKITDSPRGHSLDDATVHTSERSWGRLSFSFAERKPDCVTSIAFAPR